MAQYFHTGKAAFAGESEELLPWLRPTGFLQNIPFTWKLLPSEDCWALAGMSAMAGDTKVPYQWKYVTQRKGKGIVLCWIL